MISGLLLAAAAFLPGPQAAPPDVREEVEGARQAARAHPEDAGARLRLGQLLVEYGDPAGAEELEAAVKIGLPPETERMARRFVAFARREEGREREALEIFRQIATQAPAGSPDRGWADAAVRSIAGDHARIAEIGASEWRSIALLVILGALAALGFGAGARSAARGSRGMAGGTR
ncbi:MAG: hypothetical protein L0216_18170 [Planctomycetales bacterium]|nr:hypothetical protein [Planctomycetales bacterium]